MRRTHHTIMLICEGDAEDQLARVTRDLYLERNCGTTLHRKNAHGHGGAGALELAIQLRAQTGYHDYAVLIDTDQHWGDPERARARANGIISIENHPCLEAVLLQVDSQRAYQNTRDNKAAFETLYGGPASRDGVIRRHFPREKFDNARTRVAPIDQLLRLIHC